VPPSARQGAGPILFRVVAAPAKPGDGWTIADQAKGEPSAALLLPGEAAVYGGLDYLSPDERWPLAPGQWYVAQVVPPGKPRRQPKPDELPLLRASAPPARVPPPAPPAAAKQPKPTKSTKPTSPIKPTTPKPTTPKPTTPKPTTPKPTTQDPKPKG
jgi:hypothetical protein